MAPTRTTRGRWTLPAEGGGPSEQRSQTADEDEPDQRRRPEDAAPRRVRQQEEEPHAHPHEGAPARLRAAEERPKHAAPQRLGEGGVEQRCGLEGKLHEHAPDEEPGRDHRHPAQRPRHGVAHEELVAGFRLGQGRPEHQPGEERAAREQNRDQKAHPAYSHAQRPGGDHSLGALTRRDSLPYGEDEKPARRAAVERGEDPPLDRVDASRERTHTNHYLPAVLGEVCTLFDPLLLRPDDCDRAECCVHGLVEGEDEPRRWPAQRRVGGRIRPFEDPMGLSRRGREQPDA